MADASGGSFVAYATADQARQDPDAALIMEGDYGGEIYLACPLSTVAASDPALHALLRALDEIAWDDPGERRSVASGHRSGQASPEGWAEAP
jgi:hypothetical protein